MRQHAVTTAIALYQEETLTLEQAAAYAGVTPGTMRERLRFRGIAIHDESTPEGERVLAQ
jgi:predicted HTH domain antitoxin